MEIPGNMNEFEINRRDFLKTTSLVTSGLFLPNSVFAKADAKCERVLKAFIVSDAHFGWSGNDQPAIAKQNAAMATIMKKFPDLDVLIDTGDAHHGRSTKKDWGDWMDVIPGGCREKMFYYTTGNHEVMKYNLYDAERHVSDLGSLTCRPYYSYDIKGIHFVSVPQLIQVNYVPQELLDWLKLDLEVHKGKTTIILSHNELRGTTRWFDSVIYRQVANSKKVFAVLDAYPQVVAWCHGHNHTYEVVKRGNRLFVSNGRIGGFNPPGRWVKEYGNKSFGRDHLGGICIEVRPDRVAVKCYSATKDKFIAEMTQQELGPTGGTVDHLSQELQLSTSLNISEPPAYSYGMGGARDGLRISSIRHHALHETKGSRKLYITGCDDAAINENYDFTAYSAKSGQFNRILSAWKIESGEYDAGSASGFKGVESNEDPGIRLPRTEEDNWLYAPGSGQAMHQYYVCPPGREYKILMQAKCSSGDLAGIKFEANVYHDNDQFPQKVFTASSPDQKITSATGEISWSFSVPELGKIDTIYKNPNSEGELLLSFRVFIPAHSSNDVIIDYVKLMFADAEAGTCHAKVIENGKAFSHNGGLSKANIASFSLPLTQPQRSVYELGADGNRKLTWLVKESGIKWQVRNAPLSFQDGKLVIGGLRNDFQAKEELIIVPCMPISTPYVHRLRHVKGAVITPMGEKNGNHIEIYVKGISKANAEIDIFTYERPKNVIGAQSYHLRGSILTLVVNKLGRMKVTFLPNA